MKYWQINKFGTYILARDFGYNLEETLQATGRLHVTH